MREVMPSMQAAADAAVERMEEGAQEFEELASYAAADGICIGMNVCGMIPMHLIQNTIIPKTEKPVCAMPLFRFQQVYGSVPVQGSK